MAGGRSSVGWAKTGVGASTETSIDDTSTGASKETSFGGRGTSRLYQGRTTDVGRRREGRSVRRHGGYLKANCRLGRVCARAEQRDLNEVSTTELALLFAGRSAMALKGGRGVFRLDPKPRARPGRLRGHVHRMCHPVQLGCKDAPEDQRDQKGKSGGSGDMSKTGLHAWVGSIAVVNGGLRGGVPAANGRMSVGANGRMGEWVNG